jgi:hypothetical protein
MFRAIELTSWEGPLVGDDAHVDPVSLAQDAGDDRLPEDLAPPGRRGQPGGQLARQALLLVARDNNP